MDSRLRLYCRPNRRPGEVACRHETRNHRLGSEPPTPVPCLGIDHVERGLLRNVSENCPGDVHLDGVFGFGPVGPPSLPGNRIDSGQETSTVPVIPVPSCGIQKYSKVPAVAKVSS